MTYLIDLWDIEKYHLIINLRIPSYPVLLSVLVILVIPAVLQVFWQFFLWIKLRGHKKTFDFVVTTNKLFQNNRYFSDHYQNGIRGWSYWMKFSRSKTYLTSNLTWPSYVLPPRKSSIFWEGVDFIKSYDILFLNLLHL